MFFSPFFSHLKKIGVFFALNSILLITRIFQATRCVLLYLLQSLLYADLRVECILRTCTLFDPCTHTPYSVLHACMENVDHADLWEGGSSEPRPPFTGLKGADSMMLDILLSVVCCQLLHDKLSFY